MSDPPDIHSSSRLTTKVVAVIITYIISNYYHGVAVDSEYESFRINIGLYLFKLL